MNGMSRFLISLCLGASFVAPLAVQAKDHDRRYYDAERHDYHAWNANERAAYRHWWMEERHEREYRDYNRLERERQAEYWRWRHEHPNWR